MDGGADPIDVAAVKRGISSVVDVGWGYQTEGPFDGT